MSHLWQHPYVNVFKHFNIQSWKKASKEGEVVCLMDKTLKGSVYKITGSIPASNYIQLPKTSSQSLGLTGRYLYLQFKPIPSKYFVVHVDLVTQDGLIVRVSFSNLFKEFKSTSTWLQFPFVCNASKGSIHAHTSVGSKDQSGPAPLSTRWSLLCLDLQYILSMYLNRRYSHMKNVRLCANMMVKNLFTSDMVYDPALSMEKAKQSGAALHGYAPLPREMSYPLAKSENWHNHYDLIRFPTESSKKPFDSIQFNESQSKANGAAGPASPKRMSPRTKDVSKMTGVSDRVSVIHNVTAPKRMSKKKEVVRELPSVGVDGDIDVFPGMDGAVHVYAHPNDDVTVHREDKHGKVTTTKMTQPGVLPPKQPTYTALKPDPILNLRRIVGFGGCTTRDALWTNNGTTIVYPCHAVVVAMLASNGHQRFFIGHTDKVSCLSLNSNSTLLASGQTGTQSVVRVWTFQNQECLAMFKTHTHSLHCLSFSHSGNVLCGVGKDGHGKNMVVIWNTSRVVKHGEVSVLAKAHTEVDIARIRIAAFDDSRMVSCGRDNIRFWRVKDGSLRSAPVNLGEYHLMEFTDCCFEAGYEANRDPTDRMVYVCSRSGHIFEINYKKVCIQNVRRLLPVDKSKHKEKQTFSSGPGLGINSMCVNEAFCVTGSDDGYLRLWPLDFAHVYLEAEHEGPVTAVDFTVDGMKILAGTSTGNLGVLDVSTRGYTTVMRSHTDPVLSIALDPLHRHMATVSADHTIRVWDLDNLQQLYDFTSPQECPCAVAYHPTQQVFACGFENGCVRVFNVATTSMLAEHKQHRGKVVGIAFSPVGDYLYSVGALGTVALYDATDSKHPLLRLLGNLAARGDHHGPDALAVSPDGRHLAFVGPSEFTVTVVDARTLDEILRIDITSLNAVDSNRNKIDSAVKVHYAPQNVRHLLVTTANNKLLKFDARTGKILVELENIHRSSCTSVDVTGDGRHLVTAGDKVLKIWDYHMRLDLNFQVFIGHSESVVKVMFTPDSLSVVSVGEAVFLWDFLANAKEVVTMEGRTPVKSYLRRENENEVVDFKSPVRRNLNYAYSDAPRQDAPKPATYDPPIRIEDISAISGSANGGLNGLEIESETSDKEEILIGPELREKPVDVETNSESEAAVEVVGHEILGHNPLVQQHRRHETPSKVPASPADHIKPAVVPVKPTVEKHFIQKPKRHGMAQRRYTAPPNQAGLKLKSVIGYNGNGRGNMVWNPDTGFFAYTSGCVVVVEDLNAGTQRHLMGHVEEISTMALQHDCQVLASASGSFSGSDSQICLWDLQQMVCKKVLSQHEYDIVCMAYSRDDRFLISVGDYRECSVVVWSTYNYSILTTSRAAHPIHELRWDPYTVNEFVSVGDNGTVLFWLLDETSHEVALNVHEAEVPEEVLQAHHTVSGQVDFTGVVYAGDSTLYISSNNGQVSAWDTRHNTCFMHWEADNQEIDVLVCQGGRLVTGGVSRNLRMWTVVGVAEMRLPGEANPMRQGGLTMEDEMNLDGAIVSAAFDDTLDMGIVGTSVGTLWYINWAERASIRLVSGHITQVNDIALYGNKFFASCANDGSLRVWSVLEREQTLQFQVMEQSCNCLAFAPDHTSSDAITAEDADVYPNKEKAASLTNVVAGYSDGTVRMFDLRQVEMVLKMHPHAVAVTAISFSSDGRMIISGGSDGLIAISSPKTGMTVRVINDHKGAPITCIDVSASQKEQDFGVCAPQLWLAASADRRVSVWSADWSKDLCELVDWLTFPAPAFTPDGSVIKPGDQSYYQHVPPSLAKFSPEEPDIVVYTGYGMQKQIQYYSLSQRKVVRTAALTHWATGLDLSPSTSLIALGANERLLKLLDYYESSFQDFIGHNDTLQLVKFSPDGALLYSVAHSEIFIWEVAV